MHTPAMPLFPEGSHDSKARKALVKHITREWENNQAAFARACSIPVKMVSWYARGRSTPSLRHAAAIELVSKGAVRCIDWVDLAELA